MLLTFQSSLRNGCDFRFGEDYTQRRVSTTILLIKYFYYKTLVIIKHRSTQLKA